MFNKLMHLNTEWVPVSGYEHRTWIDGQRTSEGNIWEWSSGVMVTHNLSDNMGAEPHLALSADDNKIYDLPDSEGIGVLCESVSNVHYNDIV